MMDIGCRPYTYAARLTSGGMETPNRQSGSDSASIPDELDTELKDFLVRNRDGEEGIPERYKAVAGRVQEFLVEEIDESREIDTRSEEKVTPLAPDPAKIHIEDIAHGLSNLGRFAGQSPSMYSVARHSVHVSLEVDARKEEENIAAQRYALVHDGPEAYLSDVPGPVKKGLPGYKRAEQPIDDAITEALDLDVTEMDRKLVKYADDAVGDHELAEQFTGRDHDGAELYHDPEDVDADADPKKLFLQRARDLGLL